MSVLFCPSQDRHRSWTGRAGYRGCCFVLTRLRVVCFPCCHFSLFFTGPGTPHSFRRPPVTSVPITPQSVRRPPKETPPPNKREVFPICAARAGLFAPPVLSSFFLFCLRTFQFGEQQTKKKRRQATTQPPPRPDSPKGRGPFFDQYQNQQSFAAPPPCPRRRVSYRPTEDAVVRHATFLCYRAQREEPPGGGRGKCFLHELCYFGRAAIFARNTEPAAPLCLSCQVSPPYP